MSKLHDKIVNSINSCQTYEHVKTCLNFVKCYPNDLLMQSKILLAVQTKAYEMRNKDLVFHRNEVRRIFKSC